MIIINHLQVILASTIPIKLLDIGIMVIMFANGPGDQGPIPGQVIPKTQKNGT